MPSARRLTLLDMSGLSLRDRPARRIRCVPGHVPRSIPSARPGLLTGALLDPRRMLQTLSVLDPRNMLNPRILDDPSDLRVRKRRRGERGRRIETFAGERRRKRLRTQRRMPAAHIRIVTHRSHPTALKRDVHVAYAAPPAACSRGDQPERTPDNANDTPHAPSVKSKVPARLPLPILMTKLAMPAPHPNRDFSKLTVYVPGLADANTN